jgi:hypothetical protein
MERKPWRKSRFSPVEFLLSAGTITFNTYNPISKMIRDKVQVFL